MTPEFRTRVFLPVVMPLAIVGLTAALVLSFAAILLWNTREIALVLAIVAAASVLTSIAMLTARDDLDTSRKAVVVGAAVLPIALGALSATGVLADIPAEELNINREPHEVIPEDAPRIAANNIQFNTDQLELATDGESVLVFENQESVPHNVAIYEFAGEDPDFNAPVFVGEIFPGPDTRVYSFEGPQEGTFYFRCDVHPQMEGTVTFTAGGGEGG